ncbi:glycosyltransferase family 4 protein, partial [Streptomyces sp. DH12]|uniref:glycosyltransferase family 4 protein n=1 Tax=Streptomyces sp. DH12 TaxID=2857010 RepID=UPI001E36E10A
MGPPDAPDAPHPTERGDVLSGVGRGAVLLTAATLVVGAANYALSLALVHLLDAPAFAAYGVVSSVLLTVGTLAGSTVSWVVAREVAAGPPPPSPARRRRSVRRALLLGLALAVPCAVGGTAVAGRATGPYGPVLLTAACVLVMTAAAGAGYLQGRQRFLRLALTRAVEAVVRIAAAVAAAYAGWGVRGVLGAFVCGTAAAVCVAAPAVHRGVRGPRRTGPRTPAAQPAPGADGASGGGRTPDAAGERDRAPEAGTGTGTAVVTEAGTGTGTDVVTEAGTDAPLRWCLRAATTGGLQTLVCLLFTLDVLVASLLAAPPGALAAYQAVLVPARVPFFLATALATAALPRLAGDRPPQGGRVPPGEPARLWAAVLRRHWTLVLPVAAVIASCPPAVLALVLPARYLPAASLLAPLTLAATAAGTVLLLTALFQAWGPRRPALLTLAALGPLGVLALAPSGAAPGARLAWTAAGVLGAAATALAVLARRRVGGPGPAAGVAGPAAAAVLVWAVLDAAARIPALWLAAALPVCLAAVRPPRRRPRPPGPYRVLHLGFEDPRRPGAGGGSVRTHEVNRRLAARGVEVTVVCARRPGALPEVVDGVRYLPVGPPLGPLARLRFAPELGYFAVLLCGLRLLERRTRPDVVVEDFAAPFSSVCVPWLTRRPVVGVVQWLFARDKACQYRLPFHWVERAGVAAHRTLVAVSDDLADELRRRNPAAAVTSVPNGVDRAAFRARPPGARTPSGSGGGRDHLLYLGRLDAAQKGLDLLLRAYAEAAPHVTTDLRIAGDGPDEPALRALADRLGIAHRVHWLGRVEGAARFDLLAGARLVCMPSRYETFGMVAAEALATGTPVLAFDIPCLRALLADDTAVRVPDGDVAAYARALTALARDPARCAALGAAGPASVRHLDWDHVARRQLAAYHEAAPP